MFNSPASGVNGLFQSPASGFVSPAAQIATGELVIEQVAQLTAQLAQKHPLIGPGELPQERVAGLVGDLAAKASAGDLVSGLSSREPTITEGGLAQSKVAGLVTDLAGKADLARFQEANAQRIQVDASLEVSVLNLANTKASTTDVNTALALKADAAATTAALAGKADSSALDAKADA